MPCLLRISAPAPGPLSRRSSTYGTEVSLSPRSDVRAPSDDGGFEQSRMPMQWGATQDCVLLLYCQAPIGLCESCVTARTTLAADDGTGLYAHRCASREHSAIVALNTSAAAHVLELPGKAGFRLAPARAPLTARGGAPRACAIMKV